MQERYSINTVSSSPEDADSGCDYVFHPERVQELLNKKGVTGARILLPFACGGVKKNGETFGVQAIYIESDQGIWFIPYGCNWCNDDMYYKSQHLYTKEEFEEILAFHVQELDPAEPILDD